MYNCYYGCIPVAPVIHGHNIVRVQDADVLRLGLAGLCATIINQYAIQGTK